MVKISRPTMLKHHRERDNPEYPDSGGVLDGLKISRRVFYTVITRHRSPDPYVTASGGTLLYHRA